MKIKLRPFTVPNFVGWELPARSRQDGLRAEPAFPLADIDAGTLASMCDDFRASVFRKARKIDPTAPAAKEGT